ncbi:hypothetical protein ACDQ55_17515 [Chitinophaga sp. 30R24]|uniref:hypothetical protein n=1 Tax=Chitinophaga sp. 30R24 TaxID=3248838 RepID=UPI003B907054
MATAPINIGINKVENGVESTFLSPGPITEWYKKGCTESASAHPENDHHKRLAATAKVIHDYG